MARKEHRYDPPDSPRSVGYTTARTLRLVEPVAPLQLDAGGSIAPVDVEYETYGRLNKARDNVVLIEHALSGDAHVAGWDKHAKATGRRWRLRKPGWWDEMVGPGKPIDTREFYVICANVLGGCYGTTGPASLNPATQQPYALSFPVVTVGDWVRQQALLLDALEIEQIYAVVGGSLGGQQALEWALAYPERVRKSIALAASPRLSSQGIAFNTVGRYCIMNDPHFANGNYYGKAAPHVGLSAARMLAHITYLSERGMRTKFGRRLQGKRGPTYGFGIEFEVESYLDYQGRSFVERFDANSYLYITRAMDYYDAAGRWASGDLVAACRRIRSEMMIVSFSTDWLYPPEHCKELALALCRSGRAVTYVEAPSQVGHDAFLVEVEIVGQLLRSFLKT